MISQVAELMCIIVGRKRTVKVARSLWMAARLDFPNDSARNGVRLLLDRVLSILGSAPRITILDVGANIGQWAVPFLESLVHHNLRNAEYHGFEPSPEALEVLRGKIAAASETTGTTLNQMAVSNKNGTANFNVFSPLSQVNSLEVLDSKKVNSVLKVNCITIDQYCAERNIQDVSFLKIDTEGNDFRVLEGATHLFEHSKLDFVQFEYNHRWIPFRNYLKDVFDFLSPFDYAIGKITPKGIEFYDSWHVELEKFIEGNYLVCKRIHQNKLPSVPYWNS